MILEDGVGDLSVGSGGLVLEAGGGCRGWWRKVVSLISGEGGKWFWGKLGRKLGDGKTEKFWTGTWAGEVPLKGRFPRLFHLSNAPDSAVGDMGEWEEGRWRWKVAWRRPLFEREKEQEIRLNDLLNGFVLQENAIGDWSWGDGAYSVKKAYKSLKETTEGTNVNQRYGRILARLWKAHAPVKAQVTAWRLGWNRLPTTDNLSKCVNLPPSDRLCCCCWSQEETAVHLSLRCPQVLGLWCNIVNWVGVVWAPPQFIQDHLFLFSSLMNGKMMMRRLGGLWICVVWVVWKWRNAVIFEGKAWDFRRIEEEIKCRFWSWCVAKGETILSQVNFLEWSRHKLCSRWP